MNCPDCGAEIPERARFCMYCGARLALVCPQCRAELPTEAKFCSACGAEVAAPPVSRLASPRGDAVERLQRLVPREYAERILASRGQVDRERRIVTILFSDVKGSTVMAEHLDPEEWIEIMDGAFEVLIKPIYRYGGTLARLMGDAVLAFFGAPTAHDDDPERACRAALDITSASQVYAASLERERGIRDFSVRVGIHTGLVVVGEVGSDLRVEYTAMGNAINLASRMEQNAPPGGILISHDTYRYVRGAFDVVAQEPLAVKGMTEPVQAYLVQGARPRAFRKPSRGVEGIETRMVGREAELKYLQDTLSSAIENRELRAVTLLGEAGVGKSRLLHEFDLWSELLSQHFYYFKGRATPEMRNRPYSLIQDLIAFRFQIQDSDPAAGLRKKLEAGVRVALGLKEGTDKEPQVAQWAHLIGHLVGFEVGDSAHLAGVGDDPQQVRNQALAHLSSYFQAMAGQFPVLILLEDLHWADDSSLDGLNHLALVLREQPVMIVGAGRPELMERRPRWGEGQAFHSRLELGRLSIWDSHQLVAEILQRVDQVPGSLQDLIAARAEGNPFFIEELIKMLVEDGVIVKGEEEWQVVPSRLVDVGVPPTLSGVLQARLDRLPTEERSVLQQASVVGRLFWDRAVSCISAATRGGIEESEITVRLSALQSREMVFQRKTSAFAGAREYIFKHALLRQVTYENVLKRIRRAYHGLAADWLREQAKERAEEYAGLIADHLELAGRAAEAVDYLQRAGDRACRQYANQEAVTYFRRALSLLKDVPPGASREKAETDLYESLGRVLDLAGQYDEARISYQNALAGIAADDRIRQGYLHRMLGDTWTSQHRPDEAIQAYNRAEAALGQEPAEALLEWWREWVAIQDAQLSARYFQGKWQEMLELADRMRPVVERYGTPRQRSGFLSTLVDANNTRDRFRGSEETVAYCHANLEAARQSGSDARLARARFGLGFNLLWHGQIVRAKEQLQTALEMAIRMGDMLLHARCLTYLAVACRKSGQVEEAEAYAMSALEIAKTLENADYIVAARGNLAWVAWRKAELGEALRSGMAALEMGQSRSAHPFRWLYLTPLIAVAQADDRISDAIEHARDLLEPTQQRLPDTLEAALEEAIGTWDRGLSEAARTHLQRAMKLAQEMGYL